MKFLFKKNSFETLFSASFDVLHSSPMGYMNNTELIFQDLLLFCTKKIPKYHNQFVHFRHGGETYVLVLAQTLMKYTAAELVQSSAVQKSLVKHSRAEFNTSEHSRAEFNTSEYSTAEYSTECCNTAQFSTACCNTAQFSTADCNSAQFSTACCNSAEFSTADYCTIE